MSIEACPTCGAATVEGRINCVKCGAVYPDAEERELTWDPTEGKEKK
jgi:uncharacterized membrane protein YvbJ